MQEPTDIAVIGAGPCGLSVGVAAQMDGMGCIIFDKGCITNSIAGYPTYGHFFSTADRLELGDVPFIVSGDRPSRRDALKYYRRVAEHFELDIRQYEEVVDVTRAGDTFILRTRRGDGQRGEYTARNVVVATGYWDTPNMLGVPGEDLAKVTHYYKEGLPYFGEDCLVVGGGNSAVEAALDLYRSGADVTLVHFADGLDDGVKPWVLPDITNRIEKGEIQARWGARVKEISPTAVKIETEAGETETLENDFVFAMTGYTPDPWILRDLGVTIDQRTGVPSHDPASMQTDVAGVYIAGVIAGGNRPDSIFIETGRLHGARIVEAVKAGRSTAEPATR